MLRNLIDYAILCGRELCIGAPTSRSSQRSCSTPFKRSSIGRTARVTGSTNRYSWDCLRVDGVDVPSRARCRSQRRAGRQGRFSNLVRGECCVMRAGLTDLVRFCNGLRDCCTAKTFGIAIGCPDLLGFVVAMCQAAPSTRRSLFAR